MPKGPRYHAAILADLPNSLETKPMDITVSNKRNNDLLITVWPS